MERVKAVLAALAASITMATCTHAPAMAAPVQQKPTLVECVMYANEVADMQDAVEQGVPPAEVIEMMEDKWEEEPEVQANIWSIIGQVARIPVPLSVEDTRRHVFNWCVAEMQGA